MFIDYLIRFNNGRKITESEAKYKFSITSRPANTSGKLYYLVSKTQAKSVYVWFETVPRNFERYVDNYDLKYSGHDWSCLLETETIHKMCVDVDCGCLACKQVPGYNKITDDDIDAFITKFTEFIHKDYGVSLDTMTSSYTITRGSSHGFHVIFNNFHLDHFSYVSIMHNASTVVFRSARYILDTPSCFPIGYGRSHTKVREIKRIGTVIQTQDDPDFDKLCPYTDIMDPSITIHYFDFGSTEQYATKLTNMPIKRKIANMNIKSSFNVDDISVKTYPMSCTNSVHYYYTNVYQKILQPLSLSIHDVFVTQIQQFYNSEHITTNNHLQRNDNNKNTINVNDNNTTPSIPSEYTFIRERYIDDGYEICNRTGPEFVDVPFKSNKPQIIHQTNDSVINNHISALDDGDDGDDGEEYKPDPENNYDDDPENNFITLYNLNKYTDPRVYNGDVLNPDDWNAILNYYYEKHLNTKYAQAVFNFVIGAIDVNGDRLTDPPKDWKETMQMLIAHCIVQGRQIIGIISDIVCAAEEYWDNQHKTKVQDVDADDEFRDDIDSSLEECIKLQRCAQWKQVCASVIKYTWDFMIRSDPKKYPKKIVYIIKFLYIYNHSSDIAMRNMISEFTYKCAMISNIIDTALWKFLENGKIIMDHYKLYDMIQTLTLSGADDGPEIINFVMRYFWKPFELNGKFYIYNLTRFEEVDPKTFANHISSNCKNKQINSKIKDYLRKTATPKFTQNHARQLIYNTNKTNLTGGTYFMNTIIKDFENPNGCVQTLVTRIYPKVEYLMGRFKQEIYNITVDCWNAVREIDYEIKMSGIRLLFNRPVIPTAFEIFDGSRNVFGHNIYALSVKDYRQILCSVNVNSNRLQNLYTSYVRCDPRTLGQYEKLFYYTYLWFAELLNVIVNSGLYDNTDLNVDVIMSLLFGDTACHQIGLNTQCNIVDTVNKPRSAIVSVQNDNRLPMMDFNDSDYNHTNTVFDYEKFVNLSCKEYMLNVHKISVDIPDFSNEPDDDDIHSDGTDNNIGTSDSTIELTELAAFAKKLSPWKSKDKIIDEKTMKIKNRNIKTKVYAMLVKFMSTDSAARKIVRSALVDGDESWVNSNSFKIYSRNTKTMSEHNMLLTMIVSLHAIKRLYNISEGGILQSDFVHPDIRTIVMDPIHRAGAFTWMTSNISRHNVIWRYDFFTGASNSKRERTIYDYMIQNPDRFKCVAKMSPDNMKFVDDISHSIMYAFILCENDFEKMTFLFKNMLNDEFPGQTIKKCIIIDGESNSGKTSFVENIYLKYLNNSSTTNPQKAAGDNAPQTIMYSSNFVVYKDDAIKIDGDFLKPFISKAKMNFRENHGNDFAEVYPYAHLMISNNNLTITNADYAVYKRIIIFTMNCVYGEVVKPDICEYLYITPDERASIYDSVPWGKNKIPYDRFIISDDDFSLPYLFTNYHEQQYINSELNVYKIIAGWQLITTYFSWFKFFKTITNPAGIYEHTMPKSMRDDYSKWLTGASPYMKWKHEVDCQKIKSSDMGETGMQWSIIKRNLEEYAKANNSIPNDLCTMFKREFKKYYDETFDSYYIRVNETRFKYIVNIKQ